MNWLRKLLGISGSSTSQEEKGLITLYIRCSRCGSIVPVRIRTSSDISRDDDDAPFVRKVVIDNTCYSRMEMELRFDGAYRIVDRSIQGGEFVTREQWMQKNTNLK
jgi:hypothetical protein